MNTDGENVDDAKLKRLRELILARFEWLCENDYPHKHRRAGGHLLLGPCYAIPGQPLFVGINPGGKDESAEIVTCPHPVNILLKGCNSEDHEQRFWRNSATFFSSTSSAFQKMMKQATFSFCIPYRTPSWNGLPARERRLLMDASAPVFFQMLKDCNPPFIIASGVAASTILSDDSFTGWRDREVLTRPARNFSVSVTRRISGTKAADVAPSLRAIYLVPHFSRTNSRPILSECARTLEMSLGQEGLLA